MSSQLERQGSRIAKRRRITRACDECRKKKVKCDNRHPCIHCTVYSYECTYNQPARRTGGNKNSEGGENVCRGNRGVKMGNDGGDGMAVTGKGSVSKVKSLQAKVVKFESLLQEMFPGLVDEVSVDTFDVARFGKVLRKYLRKGVDVTQLVDEYKLALPVQQGKATVSEQEREALNLDESLSPSENFVQYHRIKRNNLILPPKLVAIEFVNQLWGTSCLFFRFCHRPTFLKKLDELYDMDSETYGVRQLLFLPLCYAVLAVAALVLSSTLAKNKDVNPNCKFKEYLQDEGHRYFLAAKNLIDIANTQSLEAIQTLCLLFMFAQCSARPSAGYMYLSLAMKSALREGLHRNLTPEASMSFSPIEIEMRKRVFYTIYRMDVMLNTMLGLPRSISKEDFDQELPLTISDSCITEEGILRNKGSDILGSTGVTNQHTKLVMIMDEIANTLYSPRLDNVVSHSVISDLELKLRAWLDQLPPELVPGLKDAPDRYIAANRQLHFSFLYVQIMLYCPFIHYLSPITPQSNTLSIQRAHNCVSVARTVVSLSQEMLQKNIISGSSWFCIYAIFFGVSCLINYIHGASPKDKESIEEYKQIMNEIEIGKTILLQLKRTSSAATRIHNILLTLFKTFNLRTKSNINNTITEFVSTIPKTKTKLESDNADTLDRGDDINGSHKPQHVPKTEPNLPIWQQAYDYVPATTQELPHTNPNNVSTSTTVSVDGESMIATVSTSGTSLTNYSSEFGTSLPPLDAGIPEHVANQAPLSDPSYNYPHRETFNNGFYPSELFDQLDDQFFGKYIPPYKYQTSVFASFPSEEPTIEKPSDDSQNRML
ncbi:Asg1p Ecym_5397 [Eremothecium cymbalariae DBVPG|uniref:Zn(2)-C6 fungal-type domain-containing protein n=1 Tax=Eremothecium cymbalariae (strain CBS 270.75 / DBVPG 7215 / KCTC 17166 / NRRL Y-17582) TaxID=931890 RepID=I6NDL0_ERECY|nr:hypothetical protein Ecym_5397 [Eremothecium cymbalariae DBVPG\